MRAERRTTTERDGDGDGDGVRVAGEVDATNVDRFRAALTEAHAAGRHLPSRP